MNTDKLQAFVTLAETLNFHRASEIRHLSPSTLSRNIKQLEESLQTSLFERDNRSVSLTPQGEKFLTYARDLIQRWETIQDSMKVGAGELSGSISIYCSVTASYSFLYDLLTDFRRKHPKIEIRLHTGDPALAVERIASGEEDISIAAKPERLPKGLKFLSFTYSPLLFISAINDDEFTKLTQAHPHNFWEKLPMIISERGIARERLNSWFKKKQITPNIYAQVSGHEAIVSMVSLGFGVGLAPKIVVDNSPLAKQVKVFEQQPQLKPYEVGICAAQTRLKSPVVEAFWSLLEGKGAQRLNLIE